MNECMIIYELIQKEIDGELTPEESRLLEKHCKHCSTCREIRQDFYQTLSNLNSLPELDPGPELVLSVMDAIEISEYEKQKTPAQKGLTGLIAGLVLICSSGMFLLSAVIISIIIGSFLLLGYESNSLGFDLVYWVDFGYNLLDILTNVFNHPYSTLIFGIVLLLSMASFIILIILLYSRRIIPYENI